MIKYSKLADCSQKNKRERFQWSWNNLIVVTLIFFVLSNHQQATEAIWAALGVTAVILLALFGLAYVIGRMINPFGFFGRAPVIGSLPIAPPIGIGMPIGGFGGVGPAVLPPIIAPPIVAFSEDSSNTNIARVSSTNIAAGVYAPISGFPQGKITTFNASIFPYEGQHMSEYLSTNVTDTAQNELQNLLPIVPAFYPKNAPVYVLNTTSEISAIGTSADPSMNAELDAIQKYHYTFPASKNATIAASKTCKVGFEPAYTKNCVSQCAPGTDDIIVGCARPCDSGYIAKGLFCVQESNFAASPATGKCNKCDHKQRVIKIGCSCVNVPVIYVRSVLQKTFY